MMVTALRRHWPEYVMEAAGLGVFMLSAGFFGTVLEYPGSPLHQMLPDPVTRRIIMGVMMGLTAIGIIYSPWGKQSGAHINPAVTLTFFRLGKIDGWDAAFYVVSQFVGAIAGVFIVLVILGSAFGQPPVTYVATLPGVRGANAAFVGELVISAILMLAILLMANSRHWGRYTGIVAGVLVATYIAVEAPLSGMSMNPARTFGSALPAHMWTTLWIYFLAPPIGMLLAAEVYLRLRGPHGVLCAKLNHHNNRRCIFHCNFSPNTPTTS